MINIGFGNGDDKVTDLPGSRDGIPTDYIKILETCNHSLDKVSCLKKNEYSNSFTGTDICIYDENKNECNGNENFKENNVLKGQMKTIDDFYQWLNGSRYCSFMKGDKVTYESTENGKKEWIYGGKVLDIYDYNKYGCKFVKVYFKEETKYNRITKKTEIIKPEQIKLIKSTKLELVRPYDPLDYSYQKNI